jgi:hypothetical protein
MVWAHRVIAVNVRLNKGFNVPSFPTERLPIFVARLTAVLLAFGTCQLAAAGVAERARHGHLGRSAGTRLSASRSEALGCELVVRDGSHPGDAFVSSGDEVPSSPGLHPFGLPLAAVSRLLLPPGSAGTLVTPSIVSALVAPSVPALSGRGPPRC